MYIKHVKVAYTLIIKIIHFNKPRCNTQPKMLAIQGHSQSVNFKSLIHKLYIHKYEMKSPLGMGNVNFVFRFFPGESHSKQNGQYIFQTHCRSKQFLILILNMVYFKSK